MAALACIIATALALLIALAFVTALALITASAGKVDTLLVAGDVYDRSVPSAEAVELFDWFLTEVSKKGRTVCMVAGNHDSGERLAFGRELLKKQNVYVAGNIGQRKEPAILNDCYGSLLAAYHLKRKNTSG